MEGIKKEKCDTMVTNIQNMPLEKLFNNSTTSETIWMHVTSHFTYLPSKRSVDEAESN